MHYDLLLKNGTLVNHDGIGARDVGIAAGRIAHIGTIDEKHADEVIDCKGLHILPGVIDSQVHFREPGLEHKEDLETGSLAAVMGGVTCVFEMPNTNPLTVTAETLADKVARGTHRMHSDFAFWVGGTKENVSQIKELERLPGAVGIKIFMGSSTGSLLLEEDEVIGEILAQTTRRVAFHAEDEARLNARKSLRRTNDPSSHHLWRDPEAALMATKRLVTLAQKHRAKIHILHISTMQEIDILLQHKDLISCEITPHHLTLQADDYARLGTKLQMNPPVRELAHQIRLWEAIDQGIADVLGSDHAPHTLEEKARPYPESPSGMTGVQTLVPVMLDHVHHGRLTLERFVDLTSAGPARLFGLARKGRVAVGYDADLTVVDLARAQVIKDSWIASRCGWTPYDGRMVTGWPIGAFVRGHRVMWEGDLLARAKGEPAIFC